MASYKINVKLCRALQKQTILYDRSNEDYRKRLPSENCWDLVALEVGESVEKCKRRWRQIRNDYTRWIASDEQLQRNGQKRPTTFSLAEDLKFLKPHLALSDQRERDWCSAERERDRKSKSKESTLESSSYKDGSEDNNDAVEEQLLSETATDPHKNKKEVEAEGKVNEEDKSEDNVENKDKDKESDHNRNDKKVESKEKKGNKRKRSVTETDEEEQEEYSSQVDDKESSIGTATPTGPFESAASAPKSTFKQPEFFIKQSSNRTSNNLIIGKKLASSPPGTDQRLLKNQMGYNSPDETASVGGGRRLRRTRKNQLTKVVVEQRQTRQQRHRSMTIAAANSLRSSTSPVKMMPLPRTSLAANAKTTAAAKTSPSKASPAKNLTPIVTSRDDIYPRPRGSVAPPPPQQQQQPQQPQQQQQQQQQQLVMARRPGGSLPQRSRAPQVAAQLRPNYSVARQQPPTRLATVAAAVGMATSLPFAQSPPAAGPRAAPSVSSADVFKLPATATSTATATSLSQPESQSQSQSQPKPNSQPQPQSQTQPPPKVQSQQQSSQRIVSNCNTFVISNPNCPHGSSNSASSPTLSFSTQTASITASPIVSVAQPKLAFIKRCERGIQTESQNIFSDDYFLDMLRPQMSEMNPRQKMHFKQKIFHALMETFDDATDFPNSGEVQHFNINTPSGFDHVTDRELRLIRELVSLVSAVKHTPEQPSCSTAPLPVANQRVALQSHALQRIVRPAPGAGESPVGDERKMHRLLQMNNYSKVLASSRRDSIESNGGAPSSAARSGTFLVPGNSTKTSQQSKDALTSLLSGQSTSTSASSSRMMPSTSAASKAPILVHQMGRRYSVCGGGGGGVGGGGGGGAGVVACPSPTVSLNSNSATDAIMLKRRMAAGSMAAMVPPVQQRARYSHTTVAAGAAGQSTAAIAPGNSLLMRRVPGSGGQPRQKSPTGPSGAPVVHRTPQITSIQGSAFKDFATPSLLRGGNNSSGSVSGYGGAGAHYSSYVGQQTRNLVIANVKGSVPQKPTMTTVRPQLAKQLPSTSAVGNVANLLGDLRVPSQPVQRPAAPKAPPPEKDTEMACTIAADDFELISRLKREPQDFLDEHGDDMYGF